VSTIAKLEIIPLIYRVPEGRAYGMARGLTPIRQASLVKLTTEDGVEGIGEAWGPPSITKAYLDLIAPHFIGREVYGFEHGTSAILSTYYHFGIQNQMTRCLSGIDIACLDAIGKMLSLPVVSLLGGPARDRLPIYASGGYFTETPEKHFPEQLERLRLTGVKRAKIKIGAYLQSDRERGFGVVQLRSMRLTANRAQRAAVDGEKLTIERPVIPLRSDRYAR
jgi:D-galactarolactone cycloisomerase